LTSLPVCSCTEQQVVSREKHQRRRGKPPRTRSDQTARTYQLAIRSAQSMCPALLLTVWGVFFADYMLWHICDSVHSCTLCRQFGYMSLVLFDPCCLRHCWYQLCASVFNRVRMLIKYQLNWNSFKLKLCTVYTVQLCLLPCWGY